MSPGSPSSGETDQAKQIFENASTAIQDVESFHFELEAIIEAENGSGGGLGSGGIPISLVGDFQAPDRLRGSMEISLGFFSFAIETISIGDTTYVTDPQTGEWQVTKGQSTAFPNPAELTGFDSDSLENLLVIGEEFLDGTAVFHLRGTPPEDAFGSSDENAVVADFWIGVEDGLFRKIVASGDISLEGSDNLFGGSLGGGSGGGGGGGAEAAKLELTMTFSNYNEPVVIEPPDL